MTSLCPVITELLILDRNARLNFTSGLSRLSMSRRTSVLRLVNIGYVCIGYVVTERIVTWTALSVVTIERSGIDDIEKWSFE